ncbi:hypothetical protein TNCV_1854221 [Trichonephila clavipes]|nr:hypothetical protein TNCV_1854221 [Trichonephila clavipes]
MHLVNVNKQPKNLQIILLRKQITKKFVDFKGRQINSGVTLCRRGGPLGLTQCPPTLSRLSGAVYDGSTLPGDPNDRSIRGEKLNIQHFLRARVVCQADLLDRGRLHVYLWRISLIADTSKRSRERM